MRPAARSLRCSGLQEPMAPVHECAPRGPASSVLAVTLLTRLRLCEADAGRGDHALRAAHVGAEAVLAVAPAVAAHGMPPEPGPAEQNPHPPGALPAPATERRSRGDRHCFATARVAAVGLGALSVGVARARLEKTVQTMHPLPPP
eukprot:m.258878 g.258878  ORF g.258878 m.258878 type:complete len:146 (-) comp22724_c1_seq5:86-523(-)